MKPGAYDNTFSHDFKASDRVVVKGGAGVVDTVTTNIVYIVFDWQTDGRSKPFSPSQVVLIKDELNA